MFIYNPLGRFSELYKLYAATPAGPTSDIQPAALLALYARLAPRLPGVTPGGPLAEDQRDLTAKLKTFVPALLERSGAPTELQSVPLVFPRTAVLDARSLELRAQRAVFVTSGMLDAIQLFARTVSCSARLNQLAIPDLAALEEHPPTHVPLAWLTLRGDQLPGMTLADVLDRDRGAEELRKHIFDLVKWANRHQPGIARHNLSHYLVQLMMRAIKRATADGWDPALAHKHGIQLADSPIDRDFLELITLTFVVLHELGHLVLGHNKIGFRGTPQEVAWSDLFSGLADAQGVEGFVDLIGTQSSFELAADVFGVQVVEQSLQEPLLEAASLWCAANERAHLLSGERLDDLQHMSSAPQRHPSHAVRVWYLNGRLSTGRRKGDIARAIAAAAESAGAELDSTDADPIRELGLFKAAWDLAELAIPEDASMWTPPLRPDDRSAATSAEQSALELGLRAWEAGQIAEAERLFRLATLGTETAVVGQAHGLVGRMLEEQGDARGAELEYRHADGLGDANAANDLGTMLNDRGDVVEAIAAFERADERANAPGAFNLGLIAEERGDRAAALAAFRRADRRGHPQAALNIGILTYQAGDLEAAEAALRRAEARGANNAATYLGIVLHDRRDMLSTEAAWRRGAERGELDALHSLGCLFDEQDRLHEARAAFMEAVIRGRSGSAANLRAIDARLAETDDSEPLRAAAVGGDPEAAYQLGFTLLRRGESAAAVEAWQQAERLGHAHAANEIGLVLHANGDLAAAEAAYRRGAERGHPRAIYNLGVLLHERGDEDGAQSAWTRADELGDPLAATNLGSALESVGDFDAALAAYRRADARGDDLGTVRMARLLELRGDAEEAEAAYRRADEHGDGYAATALGRLLYNRGDEASAESAWRRGDLRGNADAALQLGQVLRHQGLLEAAEAAMRRAIERGHPTAHRALAFLLSQSGYDREAVQVLKAI